MGLFSKNKTVATAAQNADDQSYWAIVGRQFRKNKTAVWSLRFVIFIFIFGMSADFLANEKPLYCVYKGNTYFPVFKSYAVGLGLSQWPKELANVSWSEMEYESVVMPPIPYSPTTFDNNNKDYVGPFDAQNLKEGQTKHYLGTDNLGRDVMAGMIHGTRVAMQVGVISMSIAFLIGIIIGTMAGYFGDQRLATFRGRLWLVLLFLLPAFYYAFGVRSYLLADALSESLGGFFVQVIISLIIFIAIMVLAGLVSKVFRFVPFLKEEVVIPVDLLISRFIEIFQSIPTFLLILSIVAIIKTPSLMIVMAIIGFTGWTGIARYVRGELLKVRSLEFIEASQALGFSEVRIMFKHALPNALTSVLITVAFGIAGAILTESGLSFLGIGVPPEDVTWGSLLSGARSHFAAWWLAIFPGLAIFVTSTLFNLLGQGLTDAMDPRLKQ